MTRFIADLASWYWWLSVVAVGLALNLLSAYVKPWIDKRISYRSKRAKAKRIAAAEKFEAEVRALANDPMKLIIAGQRLQGAQMIVLSVSTFLGFLIAFSFLLNRTSKPSLVQSVTQVVVAAGTALCALLLLVFMRREDELDERVRKARRLYEDNR
jgi:hypothetical protein